jgi:hypothetical protein
MSFVLPLAGGVVAALVNIVIVGRLPRRRAAEFFNLFMAATSAFYFGSALAVGNGRTLTIETAVGAVLFALALAGQWWSLKFTAIAFVVHGAWDLGHVLLGLAQTPDGIFP